MIRPPFDLLRCCALVVLALGAASLARAEGPIVAPAGSCAQPRGDLVAAPLLGEAAVLELSGDTALHFDPTDVAVAGTAGLAPPNAETARVQRGACDAPNAGCEVTLTSSASPRVDPPLEEGVAVPALPPGVGGP